jgi:hypothetical protein
MSNWRISMAQNLTKSLQYLFGHELYPAPMWGEGILYPRSRYADPLRNVDIDHEFQLIIRKMSKLSASQRREVERRYHKKYTTIPTFDIQRDGDQGKSKNE